MERYGVALRQWLCRGLLISGVIWSLNPGSAAATPTVPVYRPRPGPPCLTPPTVRASWPQILTTTAVVLAPTMTKPLIWPALAVLKATPQKAPTQRCMLAPDHR